MAGVRINQGAGAASALTLDGLLTDIEAGDEFEIAAGSKVGLARIRGSATVEHRDAGSATIAVECRSFGLRARGSIVIALDDVGSIHIDVHGLPFVTAGVHGVPVVVAADELLLAVEPSGTLRVERRDQQVSVRGIGLRIGTVALELRSMD